MKVMAGIEDDATKTLPCNCPKSFLRWNEKDGVKECAYGGDSQCKTAGVIYKLRCKCCNKFYIGKTQRYLKQRAQEHIREVTKLYQQQIGFNQGGSTPSSSPTSPNRASRNRSGSESTQLSSGSDPSPPNHQLCHVIGTPLPQLPEHPFSSDSESEHTPIATILSNDSETINTCDSTTDVSSGHDSLQSILHSSQPLNEYPVTPPTQQQHNAESTEQREAHQLDASSSLARHMLAHIKHRRFGNRKSVAAWCRENIEVSIIWRAPTISLMKNARTKHCRLCAMERVKLFSTFRDKKRGRKLLNARNEIRGHCSCRTRFLRFYKPGRKGGSEET